MGNFEREHNAYDNGVIEVSPVSGLVKEHLVESEVAEVRVSVVLDDDFAHLHHFLRLVLVWDILCGYGLYEFYFLNCPDILR